MMPVVYSRMRRLIAAAQAAAALCIVGLAPSAAQGAFARTGGVENLGLDDPCAFGRKYDWNFPAGGGAEPPLADAMANWRVTLSGAPAAGAGAPAGSRDLTVKIQHLLGNACDSDRSGNPPHTDPGTEMTFDATNAGLGDLARGPAAAPPPALIRKSLQAGHAPHWDVGTVMVQMARVGAVDGAGNPVPDAKITATGRHFGSRQRNIDVFVPSLHNQTQDRSGDMLEVRVTPGFRLPDGSVFDGAPIDLGAVAPGQEAEYPPLPAALGEDPLSQYTMETRGASSPPGMGSTFTSLAFVGGVNDTLSQLDLDGATELFVDAGHFYAPLFNVSDMNLFIAIDLTQIAGLDIDLSPGRVVNFDANGVGDIAGVMASATPFTFVPGAGWVTDSPISGSFTIAGWIDGSVIPEPSSIALLVLGSLVALRRR